MSKSADAELELFRHSVSCPAVLEQIASGWKLDVHESTRRALKYRRGEGEIIIVNHDGRGWWDATGSAKGDVFNLIQHLNPSLNFGAVRKLLRSLVGIGLAFPPIERRRTSARDEPDRSPAQRWAARPALRHGDAAWAYLAVARALPPDVLEAAARQDCVRLGVYGSPWFAHRRDGVVIRECAYTMPTKHTPPAGDDAEDSEHVRKPRPDLTAKGAAMVGDYRTDALHQALREKPIDDDQLIAMLVLALAGKNVTVLSGVAGRYRSHGLGQVADTLTQGGALTRDLTTIRHAARDALVEVLSCRENQSASGIGARHAGAAIDADAYLPNMATEEFLPALSRAALEQCASANSVAPQARVKDTRAALISRIGEGTFVFPGARFAPTEAEWAASRQHISTVVDEEEGRDSGDAGGAVAGDLTPDDDDAPDDADTPQAGLQDIAASLDVAEDRSVL